MDTKPKRQIKSFKSGAPKLKPGRKPGPTRTSAAKVKRKAEGLQPAKDQQKVKAGHARHLQERFQLFDGKAMNERAGIIAEIPESKPILMKALVSQEQRVMAELRQSLINSAPRAAAYLSDLVDGVHESAPHAVRMGAASKIIDSAVAFHENSAGSKDLSEMTAAELEAELNALGNALASRTAEDAEVIEADPEPARPGKRALE